MEESFLKEKGIGEEQHAFFVRAREDMISKLPDALISEILFYLPTKEAVKTSVLSHRWKSLWLLIPALDLGYREFLDYNAFVGFVDRFLDFSREQKSCLHKLKLSLRKYENDESCVTRWIDFVATPKLKYLDIKCGLVEREYLPLVRIPLSLYICDTLVYLRLHQVSLCSVESVSLPCLKTMRLERSLYANERSLELLISSCPILEHLSIVRRVDDNVKVLRVHSQTLISLNMQVDLCYSRVLEFDIDGSGVLIDAPRLKYLNFIDELAASKIIINSGSLIKVNILGGFYLKDSADMVQDFFTSISGVRDMKIPYGAFKWVIYDFMPLPQFCNLSNLEAGTSLYSLENLLKLLDESCPNLKSLILKLHFHSLREQIRISLVPRCLLSSLEFVEIKRISPKDRSDLKVARYFAENSVILKKLVLRRNSSPREKVSVALRHLLALPRRSSMCQIVVC